MISFLINLNPEDMLLLLHAAILALTFLLMKNMPAKERAFLDAQISRWSSDANMPKKTLWNWIYVLMILGGAEFVLTNLCMRRVNRMLRRMMKP